MIYDLWNQGERDLQKVLHPPAPEEGYNQKPKHLHVIIAMEVRN